MNRNSSSASDKYPNRTLNPCIDVMFHTMIYSCGQFKELVLLNQTFYCSVQSIADKTAFKRLTYYVLLATF